MSELGNRLLRKNVIAKTLPGYEQGKGVVIAYSDAPMVFIECEDGSKFWWRMDLCEIEDDVLLREGGADA